MGSGTARRTGGRRIGLLTPSSNTVLEPATAALAAALPEPVSVHFARFPVTVISTEAASLGQFGREPMVAAARLLADARPDVIVWSGTSGAWRGLHEDRALVGEIERTAGIPATTATLALVDLARAGGIERYGLVVPYDDAITARIEATLAGEGLRCVAAASEGVTANFAFAEITAHVIADRARRVSAGAQAVVIHCTNLRGWEVAESLERELGLPVLDSVVVTLRGALDVLGISSTLPGLASLG